MQLVEEATEGCWIGYRARMFTSEIGSVYSPPKGQSARRPPSGHYVETVVDIGPSQHVSLNESEITPFNAKPVNRGGFSNARRVEFAVY